MSQQRFHPLCDLCCGNLQLAKCGSPTKISRGNTGCSEKIVPWSNAVCAEANIDPPDLSGLGQGAARYTLLDEEKHAIEKLLVIHKEESPHFYVTLEMSYEEVAFWQQWPGKSCPLV